MNEIERNYREQISLKSDINEHIETIYKYALECEHVTEAGTRWGSSTWAFIHANPKRIISYDICKLEDERLKKIFSVVNEYNIDYRFVEVDFLKVQIEKTDLLFIDTLHTYEQLSKELELHSAYVKKYIILHDTETYGYCDEIIYEHASSLIAGAKEKRGLIPAIADFLDTVHGRDWDIYQKFTNNNGLTVLKRKL
jgi:hypothetical protein